MNHILIEKVDYNIHLYNIINIIEKGFVQFEKVKDHWYRTDDLYGIYGSFREADLLKLSELYELQQEHRVGIYIKDKGIEINSIELMLFHDKGLNEYLDYKQKDINDDK